AIRSAGKGRRIFIGRAADHSHRDRRGKFCEEALCEGNVSKRNVDVSVEVRLHRARPIEVGLWHSGLTSVYSTSSMLRFIIRRLLINIPMIFVVITLTWVLVRLESGDFCSGEETMTQEIE